MSVCDCQTYCITEKFADMPDKLYRTVHVGTNLIQHTININILNINIVYINNIQYA